MLQVKRFAVISIRLRNISFLS